MEFFKELISRVLISKKICTQRNAKIFIKKNEIIVNDIKIDDPSFLVDSEHDVIFVNGTRLMPFSHIYLMMNKPCGAVCSTVSDSHKTVFDFIPQSLSLDLDSLKCCGRLDCDTSGLLLFSTNGTFLHNITSPESNITKTYYAHLRDKVSASDMTKYKDAAASGITIPAQKKSPELKCAPAVINFINESECTITVTEGKFHEVRRIFLALENEVTSLKRIAIGSLILDKNLQEGECSLVSEEELKKIFIN
ncbi:pseudouridine synthase [Treponema sp.]|uniref:pseudouridine synthase n=1 Tax=Treponema sp. TaxID=166 RepID=UPI00298D8DCB|nr:pseudouridine synthase [Treponema sp.]MCR5612872.1 hypothetical protein [Treponema sp.]